MTDQAPETDPSTLNPELKRAQFSLVINTYEVETLREAQDVMTVMFGRHGLGAFFITATDPDTGDQFVIDQGNIFPLEEWEARYAQDPALETAVDNMLTAKEDEDGETD